MGLVLRTTRDRDPLRQDVSADPKGHGWNPKAAAAPLIRPPAPNRAGGGCDIPERKPSPLSRSCDLTEDMYVHAANDLTVWKVAPYLEMVARGPARGELSLISPVVAPVPLARSPRGGSGAPASGLEKMQSRISDRKKERSEKNAAGSKPDLSSKNKRVDTSQAARNWSRNKVNETRARELTGLLRASITTCTRKAMSLAGRLAQPSCLCTGNPT